MIKLDPVIKLFLTQEETAAVIAKWLSEPGIHGILMRSVPFSCMLLDSTSCERSADFDQAWFDTNPLDIRTKSSRDLAISCPESLRFRFPKESDKIIVEGSIGSVATITSNKRRWSTLVGALLNSLSRGMWVFNTSSKRQFPTNTHYYSPSVATLQKAGCLLLATSGDDRFFPEKPSDVEDEGIRDLA